MDKGIKSENIFRILISLGHAIHFFILKASLCWDKKKHTLPQEWGLSTDT